MSDGRDSQEGEQFLRVVPEEKFKVSLKGIIKSYPCTEWTEKHSRQREQRVQARVTTPGEEQNVTAMYSHKIWGTAFTGCYLYFKITKTRLKRGEVSRPRSQLLGP